MVFYKIMRLWYTGNDNFVVLEEDNNKNDEDEETKKLIKNLKTKQSHDSNEPNDQDNEFSKTSWYPLVFPPVDESKPESMRFIQPITIVKSGLLDSKKKPKKNFARFATYLEI